MGKQGDRPMIIAMQGDPCSGKTTVANYLAKHLKCPSIRLDDILHVISPTKRPKNPDALISHAFDLITQIVDTQISLDHSVVVDSPLARLSHLHKLVDLLTGWENNINELIIIECKPKTKYTWLMWFENHSYSYRHKWYKPDTWPFDPEFSRDYTDDDVSLLVSKLVLDTTKPTYPACKAAADRLPRLIASAEGQKIEDDDLNLVTMKLVQPHQARAKNTAKAGFCGEQHHIKIFEQGIEDNDICGVCHNPVTQSGEAYTCSRCPLAIHVSCAEKLAVNDNDISSTKKVTPEIIALVKKNFQWKPKKTYRAFSDDNVLCFHCNQEKCGSCVFESRLVPRDLEHQAHEHLFYLLAHEHLFTFECIVCRNPGGHAGYICSNHGCKGVFHSECLFFPPLVREHVHCGYAHDLEMVFQRDKVLEDYICHLCLEPVSPDAWYYCCKICHLELHLNCAFKEFK